MGGKCCVPGCKSGYHHHFPDPGVTLHKFPFRNPELIVKWMKVLPMKNYKPTVNSRICSKHFMPLDFVINSTSSKACSGTALQKIRLRKDAIPSILPEFGNRFISPRFQPKQSFEKALEKAKLKKGNVKTREELLEKLSSVRLPTGFILLKACPVGLIKLHHSEEKGFSIEASLEINEDLTFKLFYKQSLIKEISQFLQADGYILSVTEVIELANYAGSITTLPDKEVYDGICKQLLNFSNCAATLNHTQGSKLVQIIDQMDSIYKETSENTTCCVEQCKTRHESGDESSQTTLHNFPGNEALCKKWIEAIPNGESINVNFSVVCTLHFSKEDYVNKHASCSDGLNCRHLKSTAVPTIFPLADKSVGSVLSNSPSDTFKINVSSIRSEDLVNQNNVASAEELKERITMFGVPSNVIMESIGGVLLFLRVQRGITDAPCIFFSLCVNKDMSFAMYLKDRPIPPSVVSHALTSSQIQTCSQLVNILSGLENLSDASAIDGINNYFSNDPLSYIQVLVGEILDALMGVEEEVTKSLRFLMESALKTLTPLNLRRYSAFTLDLAKKWKNISPALYRVIVEEDIIPLPTIKSLERIKRKEVEDKLSQTYAQSV